MNKKDLINEAAQIGAIPQTAAARVVHSILQAITEALARGETVDLVGFGSFSVRWRAARMGRHPRTGEKIEIPPAKVPVFRPGRTLKNAAKQAPDLMAMRPPVVY